MEVAYENIVEKNVDCSDNSCDDMSDNEIWRCRKLFGKSCECGRGENMAPTTEPTVEPTTAPTVSPTVAPTGQPTVNPAVEPTSQPKGTVITKGEKYRAQGMTYQVTKTGKSNAVQLVKASTAIKNKKTVKVPDKVKINGVSCSVTGIGKNVFKNAKVQKIILGENITDIQNGAFANCRKLKQIQFQGKNWKRVASGAGKKTTGVKFVVPKGKEKTYQILIKKAGFKKYSIR